MARSEVLVSTAWVAEHLDDPNVVLIEADEDIEMYAEGHIKGAVSLDWRRDLQDPVRRDVISPVQFAELMSTLGVKPESTVVLYAANNNWFAAYSLWYFTMYGHRDVKLLDGGR
jgi:thiosulfate/3-mercaptopyruvate sulfurtransferase